MFCEWARLRVRAFHGKVLFLLLSSLSLSIPQFGLLAHVTSLRLSSGHSDPALTLRIDDAACTSLTSSHSLVAVASIWATSPLGVEVRYIFTTPSPVQVSIPESFVFLPFIFFPTSFRREWAAFLRAWCPLPAFRICFVEVTQYSNDLLMIFSGGRKWSP